MQNSATVISVKVINTLKAMGIYSHSFLSTMSENTTRFFDSLFEGFKPQTRKLLSSNCLRIVLEILKRKGLEFGLDDIRDCLKGISTKQSHRILAFLTNSQCVMYIPNRNLNNCYVFNKDIKELFENLKELGFLQGEI